MLSYIKLTQQQSLKINKWHWFLCSAFVITRLFILFTCHIGQFRNYFMLEIEIFMFSGICVEGFRIRVDFAHELRFQKNQSLKSDQSILSSALKTLVLPHIRWNHKGHKTNKIEFNLRMYCYKKNSHWNKKCILRFANIKLILNIV